MSNWKQEVAEAVTPIEGVNDVTAILKWNITTIPDPYSPVPQPTLVTIQRTVSIKGASNVDARLVDGKNYVAGDQQTEIACTKYLEARTPLSTDPEIISGGVVKTLEQMRPIGQAFGLELGIDTITIAGEVWFIVRADGSGWLNDDDTGTPAPAKLILTLRR